VRKLKKLGPDDELSRVGYDPEPPPAKKFLKR